MSVSKSKSGASKATSRQQDEIFRAAQAAGNAPIPGAVGGAQNFFGAGTAAGQRGIDALSGDAGAQQQFMNPFQTGVIDRMNEQFGVQNQMTQNSVNDAATQSGAFGGSRHGVASGVALGENARNQGMQMAGLLNQGFDNSMNRAAGVAGLGMDAAGAGANLGMTAGNQELWRLRQLQSGFNPIQTSRSRGFSAPSLSYGGGGQTTVGG